ncbi:MAG: diaminopimelate epimerase [Candidatus Eisenbacteria bacterium]|nr:diaminopimelate epimerase [Candidatus Eisenbacteria bacterium]
MSATGGVRFHKLEGGGNDFVLIDGRSAEVAIPSASRIRALLDRNRGVGGDGLLWLGTSSAGEIGVRYWNADGGAAAYCGNGARCVARYLFATVRRREISFRFGRARLLARCADPQGRRDAEPAALRIALLTARPTERPLPDLLPPMPSRAQGRIGPPAFYDAGVPHWIVPVADTTRLELARWAPAIRSWAPLGPGGTNVDFVARQGVQVQVRTWERGVEGETLACGSGLLATAVWAARHYGQRFPLDLRSRGGDLFRVYEEDREQGGTATRGGNRLWLEGPARLVFSGTVALSQSLVSGRRRR